MKAAAEKNPAAVLLGRNGGLARAKKLSPEERKRIATIASRAAQRKLGKDFGRRKGKISAA